MDLRFQNAVLGPTPSQQRWWNLVSRTIVVAVVFVVVFVVEICVMVIAVVKDCVLFKWMSYTV